MPTFSLTPTRTTAPCDARSKLSSVQSDYQTLLRHLNNLQQEHGHVAEIAAFILYGYVQRIYKAWRALPEALSEQDVNASSYAYQRVALWNDLEKTSYRLRAEIIQLNPDHAATAFRAPILAKDKPVLLVTGAGPVGFYTAAYAKRCYGEQFEVVLITDDYSQCPTRNGFASTPAQEYLRSFALTSEACARLETYVYFRPQNESSIKHYDIAGMAMCQAGGVLIVPGRFANENVYPAASGNAVDYARVQVGNFMLDNVRFILRSEGFNTSFPGNITRIPVPGGKIPKRSHGLQINAFTMDVHVIDKLLEIQRKKIANSAAISLKRLNYKLVSGTEKIKYKIQLYAFMTEAEHVMLEQHLLQQPQLDLNQRSCFKFRALAECFFDKVDWDLLNVRDSYLKPGKAVCAEFQIDRPSAPNSTMFAIPETGTVESWVGAAALPPVIDGLFVCERSFPHARFVVDGLVRNQQNTAVWQESIRNHIASSVSAAHETFSWYDGVPCQARSGKLQEVMQRLQQQINGVVSCGEGSPVQKRRM